MGKTYKDESDRSGKKAATKARDAARAFKGASRWGDLEKVDEGDKKPLANQHKTR